MNSAISCAEFNKLYSMKISLKNVLVSAFFGALGPYFNKQATLDSSRTVYKYFNEQDVGWMIYPFDVLCIILMLWANTVSVKYKMLSYKYDGAFIGTTLIFVLGYIFSSIFDYMYDQQILPIKRVLGAVLVIAGVILISRQEQNANIKKKTASFLVLVGDGKEEALPLPSEGPGNPEDCLIRKTENSKQTDARLKRGKNRSIKSNSRPAGRKAAPQVSRLLPNEIGAVDFIHLRRGFL